MEIEGGNINKWAAMENCSRLRMKINKIGKKAAKIYIHMGPQSAVGEHFCKLYAYIYIYIYTECFTTCGHYCRG